MYCIITTCSVECYWHCSDGKVHYKSDKRVNFLRFYMCNYVAYNCFYKRRFFTFIVIIKILTKIHKLSMDLISAWCQDKQYYPASNIFARIFTQNIFSPMSSAVHQQKLKLGSAWQSHPTDSHYVQ